MSRYECLLKFDGNDTQLQQQQQPSPPLPQSHPLQIQPTTMPIEHLTSTPQQSHQTDPSAPILTDSPIIADIHCDHGPSELDGIVYSWWKFQYMAPTPARAVAWRSHFGTVAIAHISLAVIIGFICFIIAGVVGSVSIYNAMIAVMACGCGVCAGIAALVVATCTKTPYKFRVEIPLGTIFYGFVSALATLFYFIATTIAWVSITNNPSASPNSSRLSAAFGVMAASLTMTTITMLVMTAFPVLSVFSRWQIFVCCDPID